MARVPEVRRAAITVLRQEYTEAGLGSDALWLPLQALQLGMSIKIGRCLMIRHDLMTEHRLLRQQINGPIRSREAKRKTLAEMGNKRGWQAMAEGSAWYESFALGVTDRLVGAAWRISAILSITRPWGMS